MQRLGRALRGACCAPRQAASSLSALEHALAVASRASGLCWDRRAKQTDGATIFLLARFSSGGASSAPEPQQASVDEEAMAALYFYGASPASDIVGPARAVELPGKGRGLVASRALAVGDLVMAVRPLVVLHGPQDDMPPPDRLVEHLRAHWHALPPAARHALAGMHPRASPAAAASSPGAASVSSAGASAGSSSGAAAAGADAGVDVRGVVSHNAYGDEYDDLAAATLRTEQQQQQQDAAGTDSSVGPRSCVGLWPHFSLLNHACAPTCVHYVVGSTMVVRAAQALPEGSELTVSYLGRDDLAPRQVRQAVLQSRYGFTCTCDRCRTEEQLPDDLQALLLQLHDRARHDLAPRFERLATLTAAAAAGDEAAAAELAAASDAAAAGRGGSGGTAADEERADEEEVELSADSDVPAWGSRGSAGAPAAAGPSGRTAAEAAKKALRQAGAVGGGGGPPPGSWAGQLAVVERRLDEAARQLHAALRELQEDDAAVEESDAVLASGAASPAPSATAAAADAGSGSAAAASAAAASAAAPQDGCRRLTRVQAAQAASYQLLELLHLHAELAAAGGGAAPAAAAASAALAACWHVLDAISRGSEVQVFQACKLLSDAMHAARPRGGGGASPAATAAAAQASEAVREAAALLGQSLLARYGRLRGQRLSAMTRASMRAGAAFF